MKPEQQRIAIAEACGWVKNEIGAWVHEEPPAPGDSVWVTDVCSVAFLPNYLTDLNAMHEAEEVLVGDYAHGLNGRDASARFHDELISVTTCDGFFLVHATAAQRAEAFLRTIGKWEDDK